jgi:hypothetical protein
MNLKWHNLNLGLRISINSGTALLIYIPSLYLFFNACKNSPTLAGLFPIASSALTLAFGGFLVKRDRNNKLRVESTKDGLTGEVQTEISK